jgi:hypothetical protein
VVPHGQAQLRDMLIRDLGSTCESADDCVLKTVTDELIVFEDVTPGSEISEDDTNCEWFWSEPSWSPWEWHADSDNAKCEKKRFRHRSPACQRRDPKTKVVYHVGAIDGSRCSGAKVAIWCNGIAGNDNCTKCLDNSNIGSVPAWCDADEIDVCEYAWQVGDWEPWDDNNRNEIKKNPKRNRHREVSSDRRRTSSENKHE